MFHIEISFRTRGNTWTDWSDHDQTGYWTMADVMDVIHRMRADGDSDFRYRPVFDSDDDTGQKIIFGHEH